MASRATTPGPDPTSTTNTSPYTSTLLNDADFLLLGRRTYEGLSSAYIRMATTTTSHPDGFGRFVTRMNNLPKLIASTTLQDRTDLTWNATVIHGDVADGIHQFKQHGGHNILKFGNGPLSATLARHKLIDEYHLFLTPVAIGTGTHLFADVDWAPHLELLDLTRFTSGVIALVYAPK